MLQSHRTVKSTKLLLFFFYLKKKIKCFFLLLLSLKLIFIKIELVNKPLDFTRRKKKSMRTGPPQVGHPYTSLAKVVSSAVSFSHHNVHVVLVGGKAQRDRIKPLKFSQECFTSQHKHAASAKVSPIRFIFGLALAIAAVAFSLGVLMSSLEIRRGASAMTHER